ncbi:MAG: hypothetical protein KatS3mg082_2924 [Nitrospiraceae bacterium]|nr:MAG: hypothetical protein KatS3mg081_2449 [Gemmatimonadales bacterium]GIW56520.1 MAG: hypothetical protein KatS3mg082_2924 [Nitrospiraceae bacterium]
MEPAELQGTKVHVPLANVDFDEPYLFFREDVTDAEAVVPRPTVSLDT